VGTSFILLKRITAYGEWMQVHPWCGYLPLLFMISFITGFIE